MAFNPMQSLDPRDPSLSPVQRMLAMKQSQQPNGQPMPQGQLGMAAPQMPAPIQPGILTDAQQQNEGQQPPPPWAVLPGQDLMAGAAEADKVSGSPAKTGIATFAQGGAVRGYDAGGGVAPDPQQLKQIIDDPSTPPDVKFKANAALQMMGGQTAPIEEVVSSATRLPMEEAPAPGNDDPSGYYAMMRKEMEGGDAPVSKQDKWMALLQASLGTMAAAGQPGATALGSVGQGGLVGIQGLRELQAQRAQERMRKMVLTGQLAQHQDTLQQRRDALEQVKAEAELNRVLKRDEGKLERDKDERVAGQSADLRRELGGPLAIIAQQNADTATARAKADADAAAAKLLELTPKERERYDEATDAAQLARDKVSEIDALTQRLSNTPIATSGVASSVKKGWENTFGDQSEETRIRDAIDAIVIGDVIKRLPPGSASDADMKIVMGPKPNRNAKPEVLREYLAAFRRVSDKAAKYKSFTAKHVYNTRKSPGEDYEINGFNVKAGTTEDAALEAYGNYLFPKADDTTATPSATRPVRVDF